MQIRFLLVSLLAISTGLSACSADDINGVFPGSSSSSSSSSNSSNSSSSASTQVDAAKLASFESEFKTVATSPQGAVKCLFKALLTLQDDVELGKAMLTIVFDSRKITEDGSSPTGFKLGPSDLFLVDQILNKPHVVHSYLGGTVDAGYADYDKVNLPLNFPKDGEVISDLRVDNSAEVAGATEGRVYVKSSGKDIPTPINMSKNASGLWKVNPTSLSSIATGVKAATNNDF